MNLFRSMQQKRFQYQMLVHLDLFLQTTSVSTPAGMSYSCDPEGCNFGPNAWGCYLTGAPESAGS